MISIAKRILAILTIAGLVTFPVPATENESEGSREGGIVGTGIVGAVTDLGSIYVNGQHIVFPDGLKLASSIGERTADSLVPGETVAAEAVFSDGKWTANSINHYLPITGPVGAADSGKLTIMGSDIAVSGDTDFIGFGSAGKPGTGDWIAVNGLWNGDTVIATRIVKIEPQSEARIVGTYRAGKDGTPGKVGGTGVPGIKLRHVRPGDVLTVKGPPEATSLQPQTVTIGLFAGPVGDILMEGYLSQPDLQGIYTIYGSGVMAYAGSEPMAVPSERGLYCASSADRKPIVQITSLPEGSLDRRELLSGIENNITLLCNQ